MDQEISKLKLMPIAEAVKAETGKLFHHITLLRWRKDGRIQNCKKVGRQWFCTINDVREMIERDTQKSSEKEAR